MRINYLPTSHVSKMAAEFVEAYLEFTSKEIDIPVFGRCALCGKSDILYATAASPYYQAHDPGTDEVVAKSVPVIAIVLACEKHGVEDIGLFVEEHVTCKQFA